jgi:hypothetical protein
LCGACHTTAEQVGCASALLAGGASTLLLRITLAVFGIHVGVPALLTPRVVAGALFSLALLAALALIAMFAVHVLSLLALLALLVLRVFLGHGWLLEQVLNNCTQ